MSKRASLFSVLGLLICAGAVAATDAKSDGSKHAAEQAEAWSAIGTLPNLWEGSWQGISPMIDSSVKVAYTPAAAKYIADYKPGGDTSFANCTPPGMPFVMNIAAMPIKFMPSPGMVSIYIEGNSQTRFIHTDGRKHSDRPNPTYLGESIGHWEGSTLVVDTVGFVKETLLQIGSLSLPGVGQVGEGDPPLVPVFMQHGPNLHMIERMRMTDYNTLEIKTSIYDDTIFKTPYETTRVWHRHTDRNSEPQEWVCSDNRDHYDDSTGKTEYDVKGNATNN